MAKSFLAFGINLFFRLLKSKQSFWLYKQRFCFYSQRLCFEFMNWERRFYAYRKILFVISLNNHYMLCFKLYTHNTSVNFYRKIKS